MHRVRGENETSLCGWKTSEGKRVSNEVTEMGRAPARRQEQSWAKRNHGEQGRDMGRRT